MRTPSNWKRQGADIIDIGAESTRPGAVRISEAEELRRLVPVLKRLRDKLTIPLSVDTYKAAIAEKALELGADIINDPSALTIDPDLARTVAQANAGLILNHMRGSPETWTKLPPLKDVMQTIVKELDASVHRAHARGSRPEADRHRSRAWASESARNRTPRSWRSWSCWRVWRCPS